jgi:hypothetical protein
MGLIFHRETLYHQRLSIVEPNASLKGPKKNSHDPRPIMSSHTYITFLSKFVKKNKKEGNEGVVYVK